MSSANDFTKKRKTAMGDKSKKGERNCQIFEDHASGLQIQNFCVLREGKARVRQTGAHRK